MSQNKDDSSASSILSLSAAHKQRATGEKFLSLDIPSDVDISDCPRDLKKGTFLKPLYYVLNNGQVFVDRLLPDPTEPLTSDAKMSREYFINLHFSVSNHNNYNHLGARKALSHSKINIKKFRNLLPLNYDDRVVLQYFEFGFPLGLQEDFILKPVLKNHTSSYEYYSHVDKFVRKELKMGGMTGPFATSPFNNIMISPLMTSPKKPNSRRTVFDASFSEFLLNLNTSDIVHLIM